ncbi:MAG: T9SS type A sorting domain-containing protein [Bacteroidetes bacterium]|nr:T9SS type A sorting domain-containing protein [Bacteroidota bacterium]
MKKAAILLGIIFVGSSGLSAQSKKHLAPSAIKPEVYNPEIKKSVHRHQQRNANIESASTTFWSEDFANGIPAGWTQNGNIATSTWEYRGPSTTPNRNTGSRGAFAAGTGTIQSATANNGFVIFDSDYLDNGGVAANAGSGPSPTPHIGRLMTDTIDLSTQAAVELTFTSYARQFFTNYYVAFSKDGGATWNDTIELFDEVEVNAGTDEDLELSFNVSGFIGGESEAMMQFVFAGNKPGNINGTGYYFWQLDDIELRSLPENELRFTDLNGAPAQDVIFNGDPAHGKYGTLNDDQNVSLSFDCNVYNYGSATQNNVTLEVEIFDGNGGLLTTLSSSAGGPLQMLDSLDYTVLNTPNWTAPGPDTYQVVYKVTSDSLPSSTTPTTDTVQFRVSENTYALDWGLIDNYFDTESATGDMIAAGTRYSLENEDSDSSGSGLVFIDGVDIFLSLRTDSTADLEISLYDTAGFEFNAGFPGGANPIESRVFNLNAGLLGRLSRFSFTDTDSIYDNGTWTEVEVPTAIPTGTYFVVVSFFPNAADGIVRIANNASFNQPGEASIFQTGNGDWFGGFLNSTTFEAPIIRLVVGDAPQFDVSLQETDQNRFSVYPNPTNGEGSILFELGGAYQLRVVDVTGQVHMNESLKVNQNERHDFNLDHLKSGVYLMHIEGEGLNKTIKLRIQ